MLGESWLLSKIFKLLKVELHDNLSSLSPFLILEVCMEPQNYLSSGVFCFFGYFFPLSDSTPKSSETVRLNDGYTYKRLYLKWLWKEVHYYIMKLRIFFLYCHKSAKHSLFNIDLIIYNISAGKNSQPSTEKSVSKYLATVLILPLFCEGQGNNFLYSIVLSNTMKIHCFNNCLI